MLRANSKRMVDSHCTRKKEKYGICRKFSLVTICLQKERDLYSKKFILNLEFKFRITVTVMKGPYLPVT